MSATETRRLTADERLEALLDPGSWVEDGRQAAVLQDRAGDGVRTGTGTIDGRAVAVIAHDASVKAGSWGRLTVEKQIRILERADKDLLPVIFLVDSAGGRLTEHLGFFPGHRGAARIFHLQVRLSGRVPLLCCLHGPSAAGGAYMPAFCDWVGMVDGQASMYLASPRVAKITTGEDVTLEQMGGAKLHCEVSGSGDERFPDDAAAISRLKQVFSYLPSTFEEKPLHARGQSPIVQDWDGVIPEEDRRGYDIHAVIDRVVDAESFLEIKAKWAKEIVVGFARIDGQAVGIVANQPKYYAGAIRVDTADKAARFITWCDAYNLPLIFLTDIPGFMIGSAVERQGIIRHGAKLIAAMSSAAVPRFCVVVRKAYAAGYYAMSCPGFEPHATIALTTAQIGPMAPDAAVNATFFRHLERIEDPDERAAFHAEKRAEYAKDLEVDVLASELHVECVIEPSELRDELVRRLNAAANWTRPGKTRHHGVWPV